MELPWPLMFKLCKTQPTKSPSHPLPLDRPNKLHPHITHLQNQEFRPPLPLSSSLNFNSQYYLNHPSSPHSPRLFLERPSVGGMCPAGACHSVSIRPRPLLQPPRHLTGGGIHTGAARGHHLLHLDTPILCDYRPLLTRAVAAPSSPRAAGRSVNIDNYDN